MGREYSADLSGLRDELLSGLRALRKEVEQESEKVGKAIGEGYEDGYEESIEEVRKSKEELLRELESAKRRFEQNLNKFPNVLKNFFKTLNTKELTRVSSALNRALNDMSNIRAEFLNTGESFDISEWVDSMKHQSEELFQSLGQQASATKEIVEQTQKLTDTASKQAKKSDAVIAKTQKQTDALKKQTKAAKELNTVQQQQLNMASAIKRYNKLMHEIGKSHLTIGQPVSEGASGADIKDMVGEAQRQLDESYTKESRPSDNDARKDWESQRQKLIRFVNTYHGFVNDMKSAQSRLYQNDNISTVQTETKTIEANTQSVEKNIKAKQKASKIKLRELTLNESAGGLAKQETAKAKLTQIQRQAYNYRRPVGNSNAITERENTLSGRLSEIESIRTEFPALEKACSAAERAVNETLGSLQKSVTSVDSIPKLVDGVKEVEASAEAAATDQKTLAQSTEEVASAADKASQQVEEQTTSLREQKSAQQKAHTKLSATEYHAAFGDGKLNKLLSNYNITERTATNITDIAADAMRGQKMMIEATDADMLEAGAQLFSESVKKASAEIMNLGSTVNGTDEQLKDFYNYINKKKIRYNDADKAEFGGREEWKAVKNHFKGRLTTSSRGIPIDTIWEEILGLFPGLFDASVTNEHEQLVSVLDMFDRAKESKKNNWKNVTPIYGSLEEIQGDVTSVFVDMGDAMGKAMQAQSKLIAGEEQIAEAVERTNEARREGAQLSDEISSNEKDDSNWILKRNETAAIDRTRLADANVTPVVDLSGIYSANELQDEVQKAAKKIADSNDLTFGKLHIDESIASIKLFNKELGKTVVDWYEVVEATEDATKSELKYIKSTLDHDAEAARKYTAAQDKKVSDSNAWLIQQLGKLDSKEVAYKYSSKKISGNTEIWNEDHNEQYWGKTIDELATEIRSKLQGAVGGTLTESFKNEIRDAMRVLDMEIKVEQSKQYVSGKLSAQQAQDAKATRAYELERFTQRAKRNNVLPQLQGDIDAMQAELDSVKDGYTDGLNRFVDKMRVANAHFASAMEVVQGEQQEQRNYKQAEQAQTRLYNDRKRLAKLEADGKTDDELSRRVAERQKEYDAAINLLDTEKSISDILERQTALETELANTRKQAEQDTITKQKNKEEKQRTDQLRSFYTEWIKISKEINGLDSQINNLTLKDKGTGEYISQLEDIQTLKSGRIADLRTLEGQINSSMSVGGTNYKGGFAGFLEYCREHAILTTEEIQNLNKVLMESEHIAQDFSIASADQKQKEQKQSYEELLKLQRQYNEADYKFHQADIGGEDKSPYIAQMESYMQRIQDIRKELQLTAEQQLELDKINNEHNLKKNKLIDGAASEDLKRENQALDKVRRAQNQLYDAKMKLAALEAMGDAESASWQKAARLVEEREEQYQASLKVLQNTENINAALEREIRLSEEVTKLTQESADKKAKQQNDEELKQYYSIQNERLKAYAQYGYQYSGGKTASDQTTLDSMSEYYKQEEARAEQFANSVRSTYNTILSITKQINDLDVNINDLTLKDQGSGLYAGWIDSLQTQKSSLIADMRQLSSELSDSLSVDQSQALNAFFERAQRDAMLTTEEVQKFTDALMQSDNIRFNFGAKMSAQIQPVVEKIANLKKMMADGLITDSATVGYINQISNELNRKNIAYKTSGLQVDALDYITYANNISKYVSQLESAAQKEAKYFKNKKQYEYSTHGDNTEAQEFDKARKALEEYVQEFKDGKAVITGFSTSADGISKIDFSWLDESTGQFHTFYAEMENFTGSIHPYETTMKNLSAGTDAANETLLLFAQTLEKLNGISGIENIRNSLLSQMKALEDAKAKVGMSKDIGEQLGLKNQAAEYEKYVKYILKIADELNSGQLINIGSIDNAGDIFTQMYGKIKVSAGSATISNIKFDNTTNTLTYTLKEASGAVKEMVANMDELGNVTARVNKVGQQKTWWQDLGSGVGGIGKQLVSYATNMLQVMDIIRYLKTGFNEVKEIDTALTELRKVTDETDATYRNFLQTMSKTGAVVGSTVKDLTISASDWARLGYSLEEAGRLAENTMVLMNVSEFDDVSEATDSMISAIQAFKDADMTDVGDFSMEIIDVFNQIGNSYAISTSDLADSLTRSSASLVAANNTLEQAVALTTAANTTVQNPEVVGTTLKTLAMRIRGVKSELEEAGEDTEGMITNTSKLQAKVQALTNIDGKGGINILTNSGEFKSTYDILLEISKIWGQMNDMDQAALLEIIAGKRAGSVVAGILQNGDILENSYKDALGADGSAMSELNTYLDSIQGKLDQLSNSTQTMWMNFMNSEVVKFFIDVANAIVKATDNIGLLNVAIGAFAAKTAFNGDSFGQIFNADKAAQKVQDWVSGIKNVSDVADDAAEGVNLVKQAQVEQGEAADIATIKNNITSGSQTTLGVTAKAASVGVKLLNSALMMIGTMAISAIISSIVSAIVEASNRMNELTESAIKSAEETKDAQKSLSNYKEEIDSLRKTLDSNTSSEQEAYNARERLIEIQNELIDKFGAEAKGINLVTGAIEDQVGALNELSRQSASDWLKENMEAYKNAQEEISKTYNSNKEFMAFRQVVDRSGQAIDGTLSDQSDQVVNAYLNGLKNIVEDQYGGVLDEKYYYQANGTSKVVNASFKDKTREELDEIYSNIQSYIQEFAREYGADLDNEIIRAQNIRNKYIDEDYKKHRELYEQGREQEAISDYATQYGQILDAQEKISKASTDQERFDAIKEYKDAIGEAEKEANRQGESHMYDYFNDMGDKFADQEFELKLKLNEDGLKTDLENIINESGEKGLSVLDDNQIQNMIDLGLNKEGATDESGAYTDEQIKGLVALQAMADQAGISLESLIGLMVQYKLIAGQPVETNDSESIIKSVKTYSDLAEQVTNYNDTLTQTSEIVSDNTEVTQEYKDALLALGISSEDLNECFDENNDLVVKDAKALNNLVKSAKKNTAQNIRLAKSQAKLEYYELYKQIKDLTNGQKVNDHATLSQINSLYAQMTAVQKTIAKYSLLEATLLGSANAYEKLAEAQEMDEIADYGTKAEELVNVLAEAFNTSQLGTEAAQVAIAGLVPDEVFADADTLDEKMQKIYEYFTGGEVSKLFTIEFDDDGGISSVEMTKENVEKFTQSLIDANKVFHGTWDEFTLDDSIKTLDQFADALGITKEVAIAYLTELEKYDISWLGGDGSTLLDQLMPTSKEIDEFGHKMNEAFSQGSIDLTVRPKVDAGTMQDAGWDVPDGSYSTVNTVTYTASDFGLAKRGSKDDYAINVTPILPDGTVIQGGYDGLSDYIMGELDSGKSINDLPIFLGMYKTIEEAEQMAQELHEAQEIYFGMLDSYSLDNEIYRTTQELAELEYQLATGAITAEEYKKAMYSENGLAAKEAELGQRAREDASAYYEKTEQLEKYQNQLSSLQKQLQTGVDDDGNLVDKEKVQKEIDAITDKITGLVTSINALGGEPTQIVLELAKENIEAEIKALEEQDITISGKVTFDNETGKWVVNPGEEGNTTAQKYAELKNESDTIANLLNGSMPTVETYLGNIESILTSIKTILAGGDTDTDTDTDNSKSTTEKAEAAKKRNERIRQQQEANGLIPGITPAQGYTDPMYLPGPTPGEPPPEEPETTPAPNDNEEVVAEEVVVTGDKIVEDKDDTDKALEIAQAMANGNYTPGTTETGGGGAGIYGAQYAPPEATPAPTPGPVQMPETVTVEPGATVEIDNPTVETKQQNDPQKRTQQIISGIDPDTGLSLTDPLGLKDADANINSLTTSLDALNVKYTNTVGTWFDWKRDISINVEDLVTTLASKGWTSEAIKAYCQQLSESANIEGANIEIVGIENIDEKLQELNNTEINDKTSNVEVKGADEAKQKLDDVDKASEDVVKTVTTKYVTEYKTIGNTGTVRSNAGGGGRYIISSNAVRVNGTANAHGTANTGGSWGAPKTETSLVGELGPEMRVRGHKWELIGQNGAEFTDVRKGDIIFNHKQTEDLLSKGYVTGRGKAYAFGTSGTAYVGAGINTNTFDDHHGGFSSDYSNTKSDDSGKKLSEAADDLSDAADDFEEVFDWIEVRLEEITEDMDLKSAELENAIGSTKQNAIIDDMIKLNKTLYNTQIDGAEEYYEYAKTLLADIPAEYREAAQNGQIAIEEFVGEVDEETYNAIEEYREWVQKGADATQQAEETLTEIASLAKQAIDNIASDYENKRSLIDNSSDQLEAYNALLETDQGSESANIYKAMIKANEKTISTLEEQRNAMQTELNKQVSQGHIKKYSQDWYDAINDIAAIDTEIIELTTDMEDYQDAINELHWEHFDNFIGRLEAVSEEAENLIDILSDKDLVTDDGDWTSEGITALGLYAQQMENAEMQAKEYENQIKYLNKNWQKLGYTEQEYVEKLEELKNGQYDAIKAYNDTKDAIVDLTSERVDAIKSGIEKEIESYEKLIEAKKEELDAEKD